METSTKLSILHIVFCSRRLHFSRGARTRKSGPTVKLYNRSHVESTTVGVGLSVNRRGLGLYLGILCHVVL